jgi:hypothetical protein
VTASRKIKKIENKRMTASLDLHAFHPKALNDCLLNVAGLLAYSLFVAFPSLLKQWLEEQTVYRAYSYGDSAGIAPASLLIPVVIPGTKSAANVQHSFSSSKFILPGHKKSSTCEDLKPGI